MQIEKHLSDPPGNGLCEDLTLAIDPFCLFSSCSWCLQGLGPDPPGPVIARITFLPKPHQMSTRNSVMGGAHTHLWTWCPSYEINFLRLARIWSTSESPLKNFPLWNSLRLFFLKSDERSKGALEWYYKEIGRRCLMTRSEVLPKNHCSDSPEDRVTSVKSELPPFTLLNHWPSEPSGSSTCESGFWGQHSRQGKAQAVLSTL